MRPLIRRGWRVEPGRSVAEVEAACAVEGFLRGAGRVAAGQDGLVVVVVAGAVDGKAPAGGGSGVAEPAERQGGAVGELAGDVGELAVPADSDAGELWPPLAGPGGEVLPQRCLGRLGWLGHMSIVPYLPGRTIGACIPAASGSPAESRSAVPSSPYVISLSDAGRGELESLSRRGTARYQMVMRARIVLLAAGGTANSAIAGRLGICEDTARKWRRRYCEQGLDGLADAPRPGRPRRFPARGVAEVKALACELPAASGTPLARWTCPELARHAAASGITPAVSASTVRRWLADDALKPWQHRSWIFPRDPHFAVKACRVLDLYQREWEGEPLGEDEYVLSADEKPGVQARMRIHLPLPPGPGRAMRAESEYARCGTLASTASWHASGSTTGMHRIRWPHEPRRINGRTH